MATKKLTPVKRKPEPVSDTDIDNEVVTPKAKTARTKSTPSKDSEVTQKEVLEELKKQTEYFHRIDWKLWMLMNMVRIIGEENGYTFRFGDKENEQ